MNLLYLFEECISLERSTHYIRFIFALIIFPPQLPWLSILNRFLVVVDVIKLCCCLLAPAFGCFAFRSLVIASNEMYKHMLCF